MEYFAFQLHITDTCDQRCEHCYIFSEDKSLQLKEMSLPDIEKTVDNCLDMCEKAERIPYFYITGGDPLLHPKFWDLMALLKKGKIAFSILGNPFHLNDEVCAKLKAYGCERYQLSIDGLRETHDSIRMPGSFDATMAKIECLRNAGIRCAIMTTVSGTNVDEIAQIIDLIVEKNADIFSFARYCPTSHEKSAHLTPERYRDLLEACWQKFEQYKESGTSFFLKDHLWSLFLQEKGIFTVPADLDEELIYDGCNCANSHLTIIPNGDVFACRRFESKVGNAFESKLFDLFVGEKMEDYRRYDNFEKCSKCELLRFCRGCPAVTYGYTGNFYGADPQCWKTIGN